MKSEITIVKTITLTLNEKEARFLKELVQNYMGDGEEPESERCMRRDIFNAIQFSHSDDF